MFSLIPWSQRNGLQTAEPKDGHPLERIRREFDALFNRWNDDWSGWPEASFGAQRHWNLDVEDRAEEFIVRAEAPGFEPDEFDVQLSGNCLCVKAEHKEEHKSEDGSHYRYGSLCRSVTLPHGIEGDKVEARYHNGVLEIHVPKGEEAKGKRIPVKAG